MFNVAFAHPAGFCPTIFLRMSPSGPGRVKKAPCLRHPQNAAGIRVTELKFPWEPFSERP